MPPNQPSEGGFGAPQDPAANMPQAPQQPPTTPGEPPAVAPNESPAAAPATPTAVAPATPAEPPAATPGAPAEQPASLTKPPTAPAQPDAPAQPPMPPAQPPAWGGPPAPAQPGPAGPTPYPPNPYAEQQPNPYAQPQAHSYAQPQAQPQPQPQPGQFGAYPPPPGQPFGAHGMPGAPGMPPAGGPGRGPDKKRTAVIIGAAVAVLVAAGGGVWALTGSDDKGAGKPSAHSSTTPGKGGKSDSAGTAGPRDGGDDDNPNNRRADGEAKVLIDQKGPDVDSASASVPGFWTMGDYVVKTVQDKVIAYSTADGKEKWTIQLPKRVCAAPKDTTDDGKVVVAYDGDKKDECANYALLDLKSGKKGWDKPIPKSGGFAESFIGLDMAISGNALGASWFGGSGMVRVSDGETIATPEIKAGCGVDGYAGGKALLRSWQCVDDKTSHIEKVDPATGKAVWTWDGRQGLMTKKIYSTEPAVVSLASDDRKSGGVFALKDGKERSVIDLGSQSYTPTCGMSIVNRDLGGCQGVAVTDDTLYLPTEGNYGSGNEIHAFDLDTGKRKWAAKNSDKRELMPLKADGDKVIAYRKGPYDQAGAVVSVGSDGDPKVLLQIPDSMKSAENYFFGARYVYDSDRFYIVSTRLSTGKSGDGNKILLALGKG
ncbi:outer membrane protein assembly factor BamB family protein [Streptomyces sp. NPDC002537]